MQLTARSTPQRHFDWRQRLEDDHIGREAGWRLDILTISRRLGHASPTITLAISGHLIKGTDERAASIMDAAFACNA